MSIVSGTVGAILGSNAESHAADQAKSAQEEALVAQKDIYEKQRADFEPFRQVGINAIGNYEKMLNGGYDMKESPAAQYQLQQGTKALNRQLAARGLLGSGNAAQRLSELSSGIAASDYQNQYNRLADALKLGTGASGAMSQASNTMSQNYGNAAANLGNIYTNQGNARASLYSGFGGASANAANTGINAYKAYKSWSTGPEAAAPAAEYAVDYNSYPAVEAL